MKFGKQLEISANPEWRDNYVQYKRLKRLIKRVAFELEKKQNKQQKLQQKMDHSATGDVQLQVVDETHPLLKAVVDEVQDAKDQFWEVLDANLKIVNDFYVGKVVTLQHSVGEFEAMLADEQTATGHVHTRSRTHSQADHGFAALQEIYDTLVDLRTFVQINHSGFRKIVKKFDKTIKSCTQEAFMQRLSNERFYSSGDIDDLLGRVFGLTSKDKLEAGNMERRMRRMQGDQNSLLRKVKLVPFCISVALFVFLLMVRITPKGEDVQQRCLAMLVFITALWVTEALPYFATALLVPPLVVFMRILNDKAHPDTLLTSKQSAKEVMSMLVNHTTILIMGGYSISAAFAKCQIELYIAAFLQRRFKKRPNLFLLAIMLMGLFLSMWISNHTAPVLCVSFQLDRGFSHFKVLLPIIRDFPTNSTYVKTLLIGLAFACNLGGMMTPISSLQNTLAVSFLEKAGYTVTFGQWMAMAVPFCTVGTILCWLFLLWVMDPQDATYIPQIVYDQKQKISRLHVVVISLTLLTIFLWASFSVTSATFGDLGIISMMFMFVMFGTGMLSQFDFNSFSWHILFLIGGGNVLGDMAIQIGHPHIPVICCALAISAAMALPFSSFPNINSLLVLDDHGQPYLEVKDFLRVGVTFSLVSMALIVTLGYSLIVLVLGYNIDPTPIMVGL
uniref:SPX domain-containing protein n=1 Tax=Phytophthora ramorum TaxID=164328 RepID=H3GS72_PHYRM